MFAGPTRPPAWHRDLVWIAGVLACVATLTLAGSLTWARLAEPETGPATVREALRVTLLPGAEDGAGEVALQVRTASGIEPGTPVEVLSGSGVFVDPTELGDFEVADAVGRIAGVWSETVLEVGLEALLAERIDAELHGPVRRILSDPGVRVVEAELSRTLMPAGLNDGSRLANWPLQAQQNPGEPVQPVVGLFQFFDPQELEGATNRQVGEAAVRRLAEAALDEGTEAARATVANATLQAAYDAALEPARAALHETIAAALATAEPAIETRLDEARAANAAASEPAAAGPAGLLPAEALAGLTPEEANERVLAELAQRVWDEGPGPVASVLEGDPRAERAAAAAPALAPFTRDGHRRARTAAFLSGAAVLLGWAVMATFARGAGRWTRPGAAIVLGTAPVAALAWWVGARREGWAAAGWPGGVAEEGLIGQALGLVRVAAAALPADAVEASVRITTVVGGMGLVLIMVGALWAAAVSVRPRRRGPF